jgi:hypothetical protein
LPGGVKGGIAGGVIGFFILVFSGILFLRYRKRRGAKTHVSSPAMDDKGQKVELEHIPAATRQGTIEQLDSHAVHELEGDPGDTRAAELDGSAIQAELEGNVIKAELDGDMTQAEREGETVRSELTVAAHAKKQD